MDNIRDYINENNVIKDEFYTRFDNSLTCSICSEIFIEPTMCMNCQNVYCKKCIESWLQKSSTCPNRCQSTKFDKSLSTIEMLSKLKFICDKCDSIISYDDMKNHSLSNCKKNNNNIENPTNNENNSQTNKINSKNYLKINLI